MSRTEGVCKECRKYLPLKVVNPPDGPLCARCQLVKWRERRGLNSPVLSQNRLLDMRRSIESATRDRIAIDRIFQILDRLAWVSFQKKQEIKNILYGDYMDLAQAIKEPSLLIVRRSEIREENESVSRETFQTEETETTEASETTKDDETLRPETSETEVSDETEALNDVDIYELTALPDITPDEFTLDEVSEVIDQPEPPKPPEPDILKPPVRQRILLPDEKPKKGKRARK